MKRIFLIGFVLPALIGMSSCGRDESKQSKSSLTEKWDPINNPENLQSGFEYRLEKLPLSGELQKKPWSDTYWPSYMGGIANRWNAKRPVDSFKYKTYKLNELKRLSEKKLAELSPAEKYSILIQDYSYSLVEYERKRNHPTDETWFGLCHGWAPASTAFDEPNSTKMTNDDGIEIPFGASDVKALLIFVQQFDQTRGKEKGISDRCNHDLGKNPENANDPECRDMNAGSFHVVLSNQIGTLNRAIVGDLHRGIEVWNHPIYGFDSQIVSESADVYPTAAPGTVKIVTVKTEMRYITEISPSWDRATIDSDPTQLASIFYDYQLELDSEGRILGGEWLQTDRVDFMWVQEAPTFSGYFEKVEALYKQAVSDRN